MCVCIFIFRNLMASRWWRIEFNTTAVRAPATWRSSQLQTAKAPKTG